MSPLAFFHLQLVDIARRGAIVGVGLDIDLVVAAELGKVVDILLAEVGLQSTENRTQADMHVLGLDAVEVKEQLRYVGPEGRIDGAESGLGVAFLDVVVRNGLESGQSHIAAVFQFELKAAGGAQSLNGRWCEGHDGGLVHGVSDPVQLLNQRIRVQ